MENAVYQFSLVFLLHDTPLRYPKTDKDFIPLVKSGIKTMQSCQKSLKENYLPALSGSCSNFFSWPVSTHHPSVESGNIYSGTDKTLPAAHHIIPYSEEFLNNWSAQPSWRQPVQNTWWISNHS